MKRSQQKPPGEAQVRRLLVITYHFPPDGAIGGQRWAGLSKHLARLGWEVHIVTASDAGREQSPANVHRHFRSRRRTLNDVYRAAAGTVRQRPTGHHGSDVHDGPAVPRSTGWLNPLATIRKLVATAMYFPDDGRGWVAAASSEARRLLRQQNFDVVISSGPPHSAHFAGVAAIVGSDAQFWMDMRDPWSLTPQFGVQDEGLARAQRFMVRRLERFVFARAAKVIVNTYQFERTLTAAEPGLSVVCLPNGVDLENVTVRSADEVEKGSVAYVGTLYFGRNLTSVCAAMGRILRDNPKAADLMRLDVAGPMDDPHRKK